MAWKDLSLREKAAFILIAVKNGIYNRDTIELLYNKFDEGGIIPLEDTEAELFVSEWLQQRLPLLTNNINEASEEYHPINRIIDWVKDKPTGRTTAEEELKRLINSVQSGTSLIVPRGSVLYPGDINIINRYKWNTGQVEGVTRLTNEKIYNPNSILGPVTNIGDIPLTTRVHETTHTLGKVNKGILPYRELTPLEKVIQTKYVPYYDTSNILEEYKLYASDPRELYARLFQFRLLSGLKPDLTVTKEFLLNHWDLIEDLHLNFKDNKLVDLLNEVAYNSELYAEGGPVPPTAPITSELRERTKGEESKDNPIPPPTKLENTLGTVDDWVTGSLLALDVATLLFPNPVTAGLSRAISVGGVALDGTQAYLAYKRGDNPAMWQNIGESLFDIIGAREVGKLRKANKILEHNKKANYVTEEMRHSHIGASISDVDRAAEQLRKAKVKGSVARAATHFTADAIVPGMSTYLPLDATFVLETKNYKIDPNNAGDEIILPSRNRKKKE